MATKIVTKNSSTANAVPAASDLVQGELAVNVADKRLFTEDNGGSIVELGTKPSTIDINAGSIDGATIGASSASTGAFTTLTATTADLNGGTIDGTAIGASSASTGAFTTLTASGAVGIGTSSPATGYRLDISGSSGYDDVMRIVGVGTNIGPRINLTPTGTGNSRINATANSLLLQTGGTERMRIDSSGNLLVGTTDSAFVNGGGIKIANATAARLKLCDSDSSGTGSADGFELTQSGTAAYIYQNENDFMAFGTNASERMRIDSSGNVSIGSSSADGRLKVSAASGVSEVGSIALYGNNGSAYGGSNVVRSKIESKTDGTAFGANMLFYTNDTSNAYQERARLTSDGDFVVGSTTADVINGTTAGVSLKQSGYIFAGKSNDAPVYLNRIGSDGALTYFLREGTSVGSIGASGGDLVIGTGDTGIHFHDGVDSIMPWNVSTVNYRDNAIDLGTSSYRFKDIYASNGTIQTSDRNEKQDIAELSEAEQRVAVACKGLLRKFRWKDSVAEKGDDARIHFGIIAQDLQAAFEAEGLDAGDYAMFISTTWTDEETNEEKTRMGVRYSELLAFIISAI